MSCFGAVLMDTRSIQQYVFSGNKLKTNMGASYLVDAIYEEGMPQVLRALGYTLPADMSPVTVQMVEDESITAEIAFNGGGKLLLLLRPTEDWKERAKDIVYAWTTQLLVQTPGLQTGVAMDILDVSEQGFKASYQQLLNQLKKQQYMLLPQVDLPSSGLTLDCDVSGKVANTKGPKGRWISTEVDAKIKAYPIAANRIRETYKDLLQQTYDFASDLEDLGYVSGESYISIVHIDGNNMGSKFAQCQTLQEYKELSAHVASLVHDGFRHIVSEMIQQYDSYGNYLQLATDEKGRKILPIRPIIIGGDDITFICPGRLGLTIAHDFMKQLNSYQLLNDSQQARLREQQDTTGKMSCCAGVAIVPAKYPFFRAYTLAEQLCSAAKQASRNDDSSWLDFAVLHGELYPTLEQLRHNQYEGAEGYLHYGPYRIDEAATPGMSLTDLFKTQAVLAKHMPSNKVKKLREVLTQDLHTQMRYLELATDMKSVCKQVLQLDGTINARDLWEPIKVPYVTTKSRKRTRWIDAIEIMDFMPIS